MSTTAMNQMNSAVVVSAAVLNNSGNEGDMEPDRVACQDTEASSSLFEFITSLGDAVVGCAAASANAGIAAVAASTAAVSPTDDDLFSNASASFYLKSSAQSPFDSSSNNKQLKRQPGSVVNSTNLYKSSLLGHPIHHHDVSTNTTNTSSSNASSSSKLLACSNSNKIANSACSTTSSASSSAKSSSSSSCSSTNETPVINLNFNHHHHHQSTANTKLKPSMLSAAAAAATTQTAKQMSALLMQHNSLSHQLKNNAALSAQQPQQQAQQPTAFKKMDSFTDDDSAIFSSPLAPSTPPMSPMAAAITTATVASTTNNSASLFMQPSAFSFSSSAPSTSLLPQTPLTSVNVNTPASWSMNSSTSGEKSPVSAIPSTTSGNSGAPSQKSNQKSNTSSGSSGASTATATSTSGVSQQAAKAGHYSTTHQHQASASTLQFNIEYELIKYTKNLKLNTHPYSAHYRLGTHVRNGGFSEIYEGMRLRNSEKVIIKLIPKHKTKNWLMVNNKKYPAEILLHKMCNNISGVVRMLEFYEQEHDWIIIMPKLKNCMDLFDYLESKQKGRLSEREACEFFRQLVQINIDLLNTGVVHRDIKSENLLVDMDSMRLVLIDFGASAIYRNQGNNSAATSTGSQHYFYTDFHGTKQYKPPEYITNKKYTAQASTIWTLGILLYDMCNGQLPFENEQEILEYNLKMKTNLSEEYKELLFDCLRTDPTKRPTLHELLEYSWFKTNSMPDTTASSSNNLASLVANPIKETQDLENNNL